MQSRSKSVFIAAVSAVGLLATAKNSSADTLSYTGSIQTYTIANTGAYEITLAGAAGGNQPYDNSFGGHGAVITGDVLLTAGTTLQVVIGGHGGVTNGEGSSGGGGSFVFISGASQPLIATGGGGGASYEANGQDASLTTSGTNGEGAKAGAGGANGNGGGGAYEAYGNAAGGAGFLTNGGNGAGGPNAAPGSGGSSAPSFAGGSGYLFNDGGFGGGGGGGAGGGAGGGGYSGGGGGDGYTDGFYGGTGGGGGSYLDDSVDLISESVTNAGDGSFIIFLPEPTSITLLSFAAGTLLTRRRRAV